MIANIRGALLEKNSNFVVIDVSGVGYKLFVTENTIKNIDSKKESGEISLYTHLIARENILDLYGFSDKEEMQFFEMLLSISGIGPKSAISILNIADVETLKNAVATNDSSYLTKVSGIGKKSAQKIVLELQGKFTMLEQKGNIATGKDVDVLEALKTLGYGTGEIREVLKDIPEEAESVNERIKVALKLLGENR